MSPLAELQRGFAGAVLADTAMPFAVEGRLAPQEALRIHRNTVLGALVAALRLSHPTVDTLVGEAFFDQTAALFAQAHSPRSSCLQSYGQGFAGFLESFAPASGLPYLADVARLDFTIETALNSAAGSRSFPLDAATQIALPASLAVIDLLYPADEIRAAIGDDAALAAISLEAQARHLLVWRQGREARVKRIAPESARFVSALSVGAPAATALAAAAQDPAAAFPVIQADIFAAPFCTLVSNPEGLVP